VVRSGEAHSLEAHIDKDEANACGITDGQLLRIISSPKAAVPAVMPTQVVQQVKTWAPEAIKESAAPTAPKVKTYEPGKAPEIKTTMLDLSLEPRRFIAEEDILNAVRAGHKIIRHAKDAIITPLARDAASSKGIDLIELI
jgi:hypothetical protein